MRWPVEGQLQSPRSKTQKSRRNGSPALYTIRKRQTTATAPRYQTASPAVRNTLHIAHCSTVLAIDDNDKSKKNKKVFKRCLP